MADPYVRVVGTIADIDGRQMPVGVDYDCVTIGGYRLDAEHLAPLMDLIMCAARAAAVSAAERKLYADT